MQPRYWPAAGRPGVVMGDVPLLPDQTCRQCLILLYSTQMMCSFRKDVTEVWLFYQWTLLAITNNINNTGAKI